jgi:TRAP-type C4-dicarboxylate transport system permease small subunit
MSSSESNKDGSEGGPGRSAGRWIVQKLDDFNLFLFVMLLVVASMQVFFRYVVWVPMPWTEEVARFLLVWVTFLGAASVTRRKLHITVDWMTSKLSPRAGHVMGVGVYVMIFLFLITFFWGGLIMMDDSWPITAGTLPWLSIAYVYLGAVIGVALMIIYILRLLSQEIGLVYADFILKKRGDAAEEGR